MAPVERNHVFQARMSQDELTMLAKLAEADGVSSSDFVRLYIRRAHAERFPEEKSATRSKKK